jgi:hypothetical protein
VAALLLASTAFAQPVGERGASRPGAAAAHEAGASRPGAAAAREASTPAWQRPERWAQLRVGMSELDVLRLLGEPGKVTRYYAFERWEYPDALGRRLNFDERGRLSRWGPLAR